MVSHFKLWTDSASEARKALVKTHKADFAGKFIAIQKSPVSACKRTTVKEKKLHALGHLWYLETHKLYCVKKAAKVAKTCKKK